MMRASSVLYVLAHRHGVASLRGADKLRCLGENDAEQGESCKDHVGPASKLASPAHGSPVASNPAARSRLLHALGDLSAGRSSVQAGVCSSRQLLDVLFRPAGLGRGACRPTLRRSDGASVR